MYPLKFPASAANWVNFGTFASSNPTSMTWAGWVAPLVLATNAVMWTKQRASNQALQCSLRMSDTAGNISTQRGATTTATNYTTTDAPLAVVNQPVLIVASINTAGGANNEAHIYHKSLTGPFVESPTTKIDHVGTPITADGFLDIMNDTVGGAAILQWTFAVWISRVLTINEAYSLSRQWVGNPLLRTANGAYTCAANGRGLVKDETGHGNTGTITLATPSNDFLPRVSLKVA